MSVVRYDEIRRGNDHQEEEKADAKKINERKAVTGRRKPASGKRVGDTLRSDEEAVVDSE